MKKLLYLIIFLLFFFIFPEFPVFTSPNQVIVLTVKDDIVNPIVSEYISRGLKKASNIGAEVLIIKMDTPGGLLSSTRDIVKEIMRDDVPVVVYVSPKGARAASAGVFITLSANIAAMSPSTHIGAAHPVTMGENVSFKKKLREKIKSLDKEEKKEKEDIQYESSSIMSEKVTNDTVAWIKNIAKSRERNVDWAVKAVEESVSISEIEALDKGVIDLIVDNIENLLSEIDGTNLILNGKRKVLHTEGAEVINIEMSARQKILNTIIHPNIAYIFMILGFYALLFEITHPGFGVPGIGGIICLILAFYAFRILPVNFAGLGFIILAMILFITEAFTPTFGLLTIGGVICMFLGSLILIDSPYKFMQVSLKVIFPIVIAAAGITLFLIGNVIKTRKNKISGGREGLIESIGEARTDITSDNGKVFIHGEIWDAVSEKGEIIKKGEKVKVVKVEGLKLMVSRINTNYIQIDTNNSC